MSFIGKVGKWSLRLIAVSLISIILIVCSFRLAAYLRETDALGELPPQGGNLVQTELGSIYVIEKGPKDGVPVIFAHGTAAWSGLWLPTLEQLGVNQYRAIAFDTPPFGYSEYPQDNDYSRRRQAQRFLALLDALDIKPIVVAHSFGAGAIAEAVFINPDAVAGMVIVAGAIGLKTHDNQSTIPLPLRNQTLREFQVAATVSNPLLTGYFLRKFIHLKSGATADNIEVLKQPMVRTGYTSAAARWLPELVVSPKNALSTRVKSWRSLGLPTAFIWGDKDTITPLNQADELRKLTSNATLTVLSGVGHIPQVEAPELFQTKLMSVLDKLSGQSPRRLRK